MPYNKIKLICMQRYQKLFKELYQQRLINKQVPANSIDRVRLIQKKMLSNNTKRQSKVNLSLKLSDHSPFLQDFSKEDGPKRIVRQTIQNPKFFTQRKYSLPIRKQSQTQLPQSSQRDLTTILQRNRSLSQRQKPPTSFPTTLYHSKNFQMIKRQIPPSAESCHSNKSLFSKRARTPSRNVIIAGCNLQKEAETHRKQFQDLEVEIQRYNAELKMRESQASRNLAERIKTNRYERQMNLNIKKQNSIIKKSKQVMRKLQISRIREKEQLTELMPWTVLVPEYQYY